MGDHGKPAARVGDPFHDEDSRGRSSAGSANVLINGRPAARVRDGAVKIAGDGPRTWRARSGAQHVLVNRAPLHRVGDGVLGGQRAGVTAAGSADVLVGGAEDGFEMTAIRAWLLRALPEAIEDFGQGTRYGVASVLGTLSVPVAIGALTRFGRVLDWVSEKLHLPQIWTSVFEVIGKAVWLALLLVPDFQVFARWYFRNLWDRLLGGWSVASKTSCPKEAAVVLPFLDKEETIQATIEDLLVDEQRWSEIPNECDVSLGVAWLIDLHRPIWVEWADDLPPVSLDELLKHAHLEPYGEGSLSKPNPTTLAEYLENFQPEVGGTRESLLYEPDSDLSVKEQKKEGDREKEEGDCYSKDDHEAAIQSSVGYVPPLDKDTAKKERFATLAIDEDYARGLTKAGGEPTYYGRAIKKHSNMIWLEYFGLRAGSFLPGPVLDQDVFEHDGDGEGVFVVLRRGGPNNPWLLSGTRFSGEHCKSKCCDAKPAPLSADDAGAKTYTDRTLSIETDKGRPVVYVAHGSHATSPTAERRNAGKLSIDHYPTRGAPESVTRSSYVLLSAKDDDVRQGLFTMKVMWGKWHLIGASNYDGKDPIPPVFHVKRPAQKKDDPSPEPAEEPLPVEPVDYLKYSKVQGSP